MNEVVRARGRNRPRARETCYLCCLPIEVTADRTTEHVLPRSFYEGRVVPEDSFTLPAHRACNGSTSQDEQMIFVALGHTTTSPTHTPELQSRAARTLDRAPKLEKAFLSQVVQGPGGSPYVSPEQERMTPVMAKIVKGLLFREAGILLGPEWRWTVRQDEEEAPLPPAPPRWKVAVPVEGAARGAALAAKGYEAGEGFFFWELLLNGVHQVLVFVTHKDYSTGPGASRFDLMELVWPLKRERRS